MTNNTLLRAARLFGVAAIAISLSSFLWAQAAPPQGPPPGAQGPPPGGPPPGFPPGPPGGFPPGGPPAPPANARQAAPVDLTGNWVSVVTEDWRFRMMTPPKGEMTGLPLTPAARAAANAWDPAKDEAAGLLCKAYGAPMLMRNPGRAQISWQDDSTLKIDYDTGQQTRLLHFGSAGSTNAEPSWQGYSVAEWEREMNSPSGMALRGLGPGPGPGLGGPGGPGPGAGPGRGGRGFPPVALTGSLKVVTTRLRPGYLRKNGAPYSANTVLTEYFNHRAMPSGEMWFTVVAVIEDPENLTGQLVVSTDFKKEADGSKRAPMPCSVK